MVSQKFMDILYQQPDYTNPGTSSSSLTTDSNEQNSLQMVKQEDNHLEVPDTGNNFIIDNSILEPLTIIKEENEDIRNEKNEDAKKEDNEDNNDDSRPFDTKKKKKYKNKIFTPNRATEDGDKNLPSPCTSSPSHTKDKEDLRLPSKRIRKEKIIFDPSGTTSYKQKNRRKKLPSKTIDLSTVIPKDMLDKCNDQGDLHCEYCGKYMHRSDYLRLHLMKHTGETPYKCPYCKNAYRARWRLNQHVRTHTRNLPYHCPYCCYRGNRSDYLTSHINRIHKNLQKGGSEKPKEEEIVNEETQVDTIKKEEISEEELDTIIKEEEEFSPPSFTDEDYTNNS